MGTYKMYNVWELITGVHKRGVKKIVKKDMLVAYNQNSTLHAGLQAVKEAEGYRAKRGYP